MDQISKTLFDEFHQTGYDREEEYFFRQNQELIVRHRRELDAQRQHRRAEEGAQPFWMRCPNCGGELTESTVLGLKGDVCGGCGGVFFDRSELSNLVKTYEPKPFKEAIKRILEDATKPRASGIGQFPV